MNDSTKRPGSLTIKCTSSGSLVRGRRLCTIAGPILKLGTKWPSMTSTWMRLAPAASTAATSSPSRLKSAARMEGAMWIMVSFYDETAQESERSSGRIHRVVAVPAQLDVDAAGVVDVAQRSEDRREVDFAFAEHQVVVDAAAHVLDVDVPQNILPLLDVPGDRPLILAMHVADVERQTEPGRFDPFEQTLIRRHR